MVLLVTAKGGYFFLIVADQGVINLEYQKGSVWILLCVSLGSVALVMWSQQK